MATNVYVGVGGTARKIKEMYVGVNGTARKVKKGYVGVNGKARLFWAPVEGPVYVSGTTPLSLHGSS